MEAFCLVCRTRVGVVFGTGKGSRRGKFYFQWMRIPHSLGVMPARSPTAPPRGTCFKRLSLESSAYAEHTVLCQNYIPRSVFRAKPVFYALIYIKRVISTYLVKIEAGKARLYKNILVG